MNIGFDLDGVIVNFIGGLETLDRGSLRKHLNGNFNQGVEDAISRLASNPDTYTSLDIYPKVANDLWLLARYNNIFYVTSRPESAINVTERWMINHRLPRYDHTFYSSNKWKAIKAFRMNAFVEDREIYAEQIAEHCPEVKVFLVRRMWNKNYTPKYEKIFPGTWEAIVSALLWESMP